MKRQKKKKPLYVTSSSQVCPFFLRHLVHFSISEVRVLQWQMFITHSHPKSMVGGGYSYSSLSWIWDSGWRSSQPLAVGLVETYITFSKEWSSWPQWGKVYTKEAGCALNNNASYYKPFILYYKPYIHIYMYTHTHTQRIYSSVVLSILISNWLVVI